MLSEREQRSLVEIELSLRADDRPLARSLELFRLEPLLAEYEEETRRTALRTFVRRARWVLAITSVVLILPLWAAVVTTSGIYAAMAQISVLPLSSLLLAAGMALHPDRRRRTPRRVAQRRTRDSDGHGWPANTR